MELGKWRPQHARYSETEVDGYERGSVNGTGLARHDKPTPMVSMVGIAIPTHSIFSSLSTLYPQGRDGTHQYTCRALLSASLAGCGSEARQVYLRDSPHAWARTTASYLGQGSGRPPGAASRSVKPADHKVVVDYWWRAVEARPHSPARPEGSRTGTRVTSAVERATVSSPHALAVAKTMAAAAHPALE